jgi:hypothetical protein
LPSHDFDHNRHALTRERVFVRSRAHLTLSLNPGAFLMKDSAG